MAISEIKGQEAQLSLPVKEGQGYININPGCLFAQ